MSETFTPHPAAVEWNAFVHDPDNATLFADSARGKYLHNRLWHAFMAGYKAAEQAHSLTNLSDGVPTGDTNE